MLSRNGSTPINNKYSYSTWYWSVAVIQCITFTCIFFSKTSIRFIKFPTAKPTAVNHRKRLILFVSQLFEAIFSTLNYLITVIIYANCVQTALWSQLLSINFSIGVGKISFNYSVWRSFSETTALHILLFWIIIKCAPVTVFNCIILNSGSTGLYCIPLAILETNINAFHVFSTVDVTGENHKNWGFKSARCSPFFQIFMKLLLDKLSKKLRFCWLLFGHYCVTECYSVLPWRAEINGLAAINYLPVINDRPERWLVYDTSNLLIYQYP